MRRLLFAIGLVLALPAVAQAGALVINPQLTLNFSRYSTDADSVANEARVGYGLGGFVRVGAGRAYFQPGVFYQKTTINLVDESVTTSQLEDELGVTSFWIPATLGVYIVDAGMFNLRGTAGPAVSFVTSVKDNQFGLEKDDYKSLIWGGVVGLGADIAMVSVDLSYEFGLSDVFEEAIDGENAKQNTFRAGVGLVFR